MKKIKLIKQHDEKDCGAACLSMILEYYGRKISMTSVREAIQVDQQGASVFGVVDGAQKNGLISQAFEGTAEEIVCAVDEKIISLPTVVRIINESGYEHYVVVGNIKNNEITIYDPDTGKKKISMEQFTQIFLGQIISFRKGPDFKEEKERRNSFVEFAQMITHQKGLLLVISVLSLGVTAIGLTGAFLFRFLVDNVLSNLDDVDAIDKKLAMFASLITALIILYLVKLVVQMLRGKLLMVMSKNIDLPLMLGYYDHVTALPMNFFDTRKTGEIMSRFNDAGKIRDAISNTALTLIIDSVMVIVCGVFLFQISPVLFIDAAVTFFVYLLISALYIKPLDICNHHMMEQQAQFSSYMKESIDGMETVKTSQAERTIKEKTHKLFQDYLNSNIKQTLMSLSKEAIIEFVTSVSTLILLWIGAVNVVNGTMSLGSLITFVSLLNYFLEPIQNFANLQSNLQSAVVAAERLKDVTDLKTEETGAIVPNTPLTMLDFKNVSFRYGTRTLTLDNINFTAKKGEQIAFVGESGCGKSTTAKLLQGLYLPESGLIRINDIELGKLSLSWLRKQTACVPQNTYLFSDTIKNNLILGLNKEEVPLDKEIEQILEICSCQFVKQLPLGLNFVLEENGSNLSGGQRQRLAIARALLRKPHLLILDEATSALDTITEYKIQQAIQDNYPEMIVVLIAHRLSTIRHCSNILVVDKGKIIEHGTHEELLQYGHSYSNMWSKQNGCME